MEASWLIPTRIKNGNKPRWCELFLYLQYFSSRRIDWDNKVILRLARGKRKVILIDKGGMLFIM